MLQHVVQVVGEVAELVLRANVDAPREVTSPARELARGDDELPDGTRDQDRQRDAAEQGQGAQHEERLPLAPDEPALGVVGHGRTHHDELAHDSLGVPGVPLDVAVEVVVGLSVEVEGLELGPDVRPGDGLGERPCEVPACGAGERRREDPSALRHERIADLLGGLLGALRAELGEVLLDVAPDDDRPELPPDRDTRSLIDPGVEDEELARDGRGPRGLEELAAPHVLGGDEALATEPDGLSLAVDEHHEVGAEVLAQVDLQARHDLARARLVTAGERGA